MVKIEGNLALAFIDINFKPTSEADADVVREVNLETGATAWRFTQKYLDKRAKERADAEAAS